MDLFRFIDSKDIAEHLKSINYQFTAPEAAYLVYQCHLATLEEKFAAWQEIIDTMPDCSMDARYDMEAINSFHGFLRQYIDLQQKMLKLFFEKDNAVYTFRICGYMTGSCKNNMPYKNNWVTTENEYYSMESEEVFSDFGTCIADYKDNYFGDDIKFAVFTKRTLFQPNNERQEHKIDIVLNSELEITSITYEGELLQNSERDVTKAFDGMWFSFPTPFKRGDILINKHHPDEPFVLNSIYNWTPEEALQNGFSKDDYIFAVSEKSLRHFKQQAGFSDMGYTGYFIKHCPDDAFHVCFDDGWTYLNLERYTKPLTNEKRALQAISNMFSPSKNRSMNIEMLYNACHFILEEERIKRLRKFFDCYTEEALKRAGLL